MLRAPAGASVLVEAGRPLDLSWEAGSDLVYIDVDGAESPWRCTFADEGGQGTIPAQALAAAGTLRIHRLHHEPLVAPGIERGELRFDLARVIPYRTR